MESASKPKIGERVLHTLRIDNFQGTITPPDTGWRVSGNQAQLLNFQLGNHHIEPGQFHSLQRFHPLFKAAGEPLKDLDRGELGRAAAMGQSVCTPLS